MADHQIDAPLPRFHSVLSTNVARAAYLKMHYGALDGEEIEALFDRIAWDDADSVSLDVLRAIYDLSKPSGLSVWAQTNEDTIERFRNASPALLRALVLADDGATFLRLRVATTPEPDNGYLPFAYRSNVAHLVSDQSDDFRETFAALAEEKGEIHLAAAILTGHSDLAKFDDVVARNDAVFEQDERRRNWEFFGYSDAMRERKIEAIAEESPEYGAFIREQYAIEAATRATYPTSFLWIYYNQSGALAQSSAAAQTVLNAIATGDDDPLAEPETFWLLAFQSLLDGDDPDEVRRQLARLGFATTTRWHELRDALSQLDVMAAKAALGPYVQGDLADPPAMPDNSTVDWDAWLSAAEALRVGELNAAFAASPTATIELLWAAEEYAAAWRLTLANAGGENSPDTLKMATDLMTRLDMLCDQRMIVLELNGNWGRQPLMHFPN
ncbi:hypothetical protein [Octadecabacter algicola]|uniref:hypothetical protein n=1 Tax=Octadecabacter algicola TaxID=2909342 RepID=UPI001F16FBB5|nr:hypothetical protein [Octadecabacter algicola]